MDEMSLSEEEEKHLWLKVEDTLPLATTMLRPSLPPWLVPRAVTIFSCVCGGIFGSDHSWSSLLLPGPFSRWLQQTCSRAGSGIFVPCEHQHPACPPDCSGHTGLPQGTQADNSACSDGSSGALCPHLYTIIFPVTPLCDQGHDSLGLPYKVLNNACFKGCIGGVRYSGHLATKTENWMLAALLGMPCDFRHSQDFPAQLHAITTLLFRSILKPKYHPSVEHRESYAPMMCYHPSLWPCTIMKICQSKLCL